MIAEIRSGIIVPLDPSAYSRALAQHEGKRVDVTVERWRLSRSAQQNRYYWGVPIPILGEHLGYHKDEMDAAITYKFGGIMDQKTGLMVARGTSSLNTAEFEERMTRVRMWASTDLGVFIPLPNEYVPGGS